MSMPRTSRNLVQKSKSRRPAFQQTRRDGSRTMERFYYGKSIKTFLEEDVNSILGALSDSESFDTAREQKNAWLDEIRLLKAILQGHDGFIFFEYSIPRLGKRADVILLINNVVLC